MRCDVVIMHSAASACVTKCYVLPGAYFKQQHAMRSNTTRRVVFVFVCLVVGCVMCYVLW
jgi:hypothetical protein